MLVTHESVGKSWNHLREVLIINFVFFPFFRFDEQLRARVSLSFAVVIIMNRTDTKLAFLCAVSEGLLIYLTFQSTKNMPEARIYDRPCL